ncbi:alginate lyase family protein [Candidatus Thioglobus sp.]|nr:alginate lyase family protein [Candidatus Thioglobus sp.]
MKKLFLFVALSLLSLQGYSANCSDGSEPTKTISDDGTYFEYKCNNNKTAEIKGGVAYDSFPVHEFAKSPLRDLEVQENWQLFKDPYELDLFHSRFQYAIDEKGPLRWWKMSSYVDDCERATAEFDIEAFKSIEETGDRASFFIRCKTFFTHKHFRDQDEGIKVFERILLSWAKNKPIKYPDTNLKTSSFSDTAYAATMTVGDFASFYAVYYDDFNFTREQRQAVNDYLSDLLINYDLEPNRNSIRCVLEEPERFEIEGYEAFGIYADYCGSNRWRMGLGAVYLGLRTGNQKLFTAGNRHIEINLAAIDKDGIFPQWARKGALALSYQRQLPEVLTLLALAYESIDYDFYEHQLPHGKKIHEVYEALFDFIYHPEKLNKYAFAAWDFVGQDAYAFDKLPLKEKWRREYIYPEVLAAQSKGYVLRYRPDLMGDIDYSENWMDRSSEYVGVFVSISGIAIYEAVNQNISKIELEIAKKAEEKTDFCKESVDGLNTAIWFAASTKDDIEWEFVGTEKISFDGCKGQFEATEDFQPEDWFMMSKALRKDLNVSVKPDGTINISGDLDLDYSEIQRINIKSNSQGGEVLGYFNPGWRLKVELKSK